MTDLSGIGPPQGNPLQRRLGEDAIRGNLDPGVRRRLWHETGAHQATGSTLGNILTLGGNTAALAQGFLDANIGLFRGIRDLTGLSFGLDDEDVPRTATDLLPKDLARNLAGSVADAHLFGLDTEGASRFAGELLSYMGTGGAGAAGKALESVNLVSKALRPLTAVGGIGARALANSARLGRFAKAAKALEPAIAGATGFGLYNALATEGDWDERKAAMLHGMVAGAAIGVAGKLAQTAESAMLNRALKPEQIEKLGSVLKTLRAGKLPSWDQVVATAAKGAAGGVGTLIENTAFATMSPEFWDALTRHDYDKALDLYVQTIPGTVLARTGRPDGFLGWRRENPDLNTTETRFLVYEMRRGEREAAPSGESPRGVETPQEPAPQEPQSAPKSRPKLLTYSRPKKELDAIADPLWKSGWEIPDGLPKEGTIEVEYPGGGRVSIDLDGGSITVTRGLFRLVRGESADIERAAGVSPVYLWARNTVERFDADAKNPTQQVEVDADIARALLSRAPKGSRLRGQLDAIVRSDAPYGPVEVSAIDLAKTALRWHRQEARHPNAERVDGWLANMAKALHGRAVGEAAPEGSIGKAVAESGGLPITDTVTMTGDVAREFTRDLAAITMLRRMGSEMLFRLPEQTAGGYWKSPDGRLVFIGLDGKPYSRRVQGEGDPDVRQIRDLPKPELQPPDTPQLQEWHALVETLRDTTTRKNIGLDLLEAAVATASNGSPHSPSVQHLRQFFHSVDPKVVAEILTPETLRELGMRVGRIGSGHATADAAMREIADTIPQIQEARSKAEKLAEQAKEPEDADEVRLREMTQELERLRDETRESGEEEAASVLDQAIKQLQSRSRVVMQRELERLRDEALDDGETEVARILGEKAETLRGRESEAGYIDLGPVVEALRNAGRGAQRFLKEVRDAIQRVVDYMFETRAEAIRKVMPNSRLAQKGLQALSLGREIFGEASSRWVAAEKAVKRHKGGRAWVNEWMVFDEGQWRPVKDGEAGEYRRWELLTDGRIKLPESAPDWQREFVEHARSANKYLFDTAASYGAVRATHADPTLPRPLMASNNVVQRLPGRDADQVMGDAGLRRRWFEFLVSRPLNAKVEVGNGKNARKITAQDLEKAYQSARKSDVKVQDAEQEAAFEHYRLLPDVPMQWRDPVTKRTFEMRESDPADVMGRVLRSQSMRAATIAVMGQDLTPTQRKNLAQWLESPESLELPAKQREAVVRNALQKLGPTGEFKAWRDALYSDDPSAPKMSERRKARLAERTREWVEMVQGRFPSAHPVSRAVAALDLIPRSFRVAKAFVLDLPEMVTLPMFYGGMGRGASALRDFAKHPVDTIAMAWRTGAVMRGIGEIVLGEVHKPKLGIDRIIHAVSNGLTAPGAVTEWAKGAVNTVLANKMLESWASGKPTTRDRWLLEHMRFDPAQIEALLSGKAPRALQSQFRNEFVQMVTSRRGFGEGSALADNPDARAWFRYLRWASARAGEVARMVADIGLAVRDHGRMSRQAMTARGNLGLLLGVLGVGGMAGKLAGYVVTAALSGDLDRGWPRFLRELEHSWDDMFLDALWNQTVGGPWGRAISMSANPSNAKKLASTNVGTALLYSLSRTLQAASRGDVGMVYEALRSYGWIPLAGEGERIASRIRMKGWLASLLGADVLVSAKDQALSDHDLVMEWRFGAGAPKGNLGLPLETGGQFAPSNDPAFYSHMKRALDTYYEVMGEASDDDTAEEVARRGFRAALEELEKARAVDGVKKGSIASYVRSQRHFRGMSADDVLEFMKYAGTERTSAMLTHDRLLDGFAREADRLRHVPLADPEWAARVERFRALAGAGKLDNETLDDALHYTSTLYRSGSYDDSRVEELAHAIAMSDDLVRDTFKGRQVEGILTIRDHAIRSLVITGELMKRARTRATMQEKKDAERDR